MKIAVQLKLLPGETVRDQAQWAQDHGVEGIELGVWGGGLPKCVARWTRSTAA